MTDRQLIAEIKKIRARNNGNWMAILELAFDLDKARARRIFGSIMSCDGRIQRLSKRLARGRG